MINYHWSMVARTRYWQIMADKNTLHVQRTDNTGKRLKAVKLSLRIKAKNIAVIEHVFPVINCQYINRLK